MGCPNCGHGVHEAGQCEVLLVYDRPGGPPGNQRCLCGVSMQLNSPLLRMRAKKIDLTDDDRARARFSITEMEFLSDPEEQAEFLAGEFARARIAHSGKAWSGTEQSIPLLSGTLRELRQLGIWPMVMGVRDGLRRILRRHD